MADAPSRASSPPKGGKASTRNLLIAGGVAVGVGALYLLWKKSQASSASSGSSADDTEAPAKASTGMSWEQFLLWLHDHQSSPTKKKTKPKKKSGGGGPTKGSHTRAITVEKDETFAEFAKSRNWTPSTIKAVEDMNRSQFGGNLTPKTKLRKGETIIRPLGH